MFSGIIEATAKIIKSETLPGVLRIWLLRPQNFQDLKVGDSVACNGVCLTVENFDQASIQCALAHETLKLLNLRPDDSLVGQTWNLERSLRFGDRIHGHLVTGHVEALGSVVHIESEGESLLLNILVPDFLRKFIWTKGSISLNGVSLTVNRFEDSMVQICLIPETIKRTNLSELKVGSLVNVETDYMAKAYFQGKDHGLS